MEKKASKQSQQEDVKKKESLKLESTGKKVEAGQEEVNKSQLENEAVEEDLEWEERRKELTKKFLEIDQIYKKCKFPPAL